MPSVVPRRTDAAQDADVLVEQHHPTEVAGSALVRLCAVGFVAYCSYAICRTPLLPLFARDLGAGPSLIGFVMGASTLTGIVLKLPAGAWSDILGRRPLLVIGRARVRDPAVHLPGRVDAGGTHHAPVRARQRDGHLRTRRGGEPVGHRPARSARRMAQHLRHGARGWSGGWPDSGRVSDCGRPVRPRVSRGRSHRPRRSPDCGGLATGFDRAPKRGPLAGVQGRRRRSGSSPPGARRRVEPRRPSSS